MELFIKNARAQDGKIVKTLVKSDGIDETIIAFAREYGFATIYPLDRESEDNARAILEKAVVENYEGPVSKLMKKE